MSPERRKKLKEVFGAALDHVPAERDAFLDAACGGDADLRAEAQSLLAAHGRAGSFIEAAAPDLGRLVVEVAAGMEDPGAGRRIGSYRLLEVIGRGGMGTVYRALRDDEFQKQVALKLIRGGLASEVVLRRFREERQILARLEHPNIATLHDGGTTAEGQPYLVMELIEGEPVDAYCQRHALPIKERLALFRTICSAVHYAHQNLVVHRDLKPANILVTADGVPKLLDFGIAKLLSADEDPASAPTATVLPLLTPEYASPEQVQGRPVTTASDVYSLGVILYQLLTGRRPYELGGRSPEKLLRAVCETEPERPSAVASGSRAASAELAGDLDTIVLKALRKEPARRYASAQELGEDLRRYLEGLPVLARGDSLGYRAGKLVRRHKAGVAAAALAMVGLVTGTIVALHQASVADEQRARAERRFNDVRELANSFVFEVHDAIQDLSGATKARGLIVKRALEYLDKLVKEAAGDTSLQRDLVTAYVKLGDIQGRRNRANLGDTAGARASYEKALALGEALVAANPGDATGRRRLAQAHNKHGELLFIAADPRTAASAHEKALRQYEALASKSPDDLAAREGLASTLSDLGYMKAAGGDLLVGLGDLLEAARRFEAIVPASRDPPKTRDRLAKAYGRIAELQDELAPKKGAGLEMYRKELRINEDLARADPKNARLARGIFVGLVHVGESLLDMGDTVGALATFRRAATLIEPISAADPANAQYRSDLGAILQLLADAQVQSGDPEKALPNLERARSILEPLAASDPRNLATQARVADVNMCLGQAHAALAVSRRTAARARLAHWREARSRLRKGYEIWLDLKNRGNDVPSVRAKLETLTRELAKCDAALGRATERAGSR